MSNLLLVCANPLLAQDLKSQLELYVPDLTVYENYDEETVFDVAVVDEQVSAAEEIRARLPKTPVILLAGAGAENIAGFPAVICKPMRLEDFLDAVRSCANVFANSREGVLRFNRYELNPGSKSIVNLRNREKIKLTEREVAILKYLYRARNKIVSKNELLSEVWGYNPEATTHTVETHIYRLRQKVEHDKKDFQIIVTEDNGYKLKP